MIQTCDRNNDADVNRDVCLQNVYLKSSSVLMCSQCNLVRYLKKKIYELVLKGETYRTMNV
jgi:hypothetical protein